MEITKNTFIDSGLQLSKNFLLEHLSSGAYHQGFGKFMPVFSSKLSSNSQNILYNKSIPTWKIARSLQVGSQNILENLVSGFGSDLVLRSAFLNNINNDLKNFGVDDTFHRFGMGIDISINGYEDNLYPVAKELQKIIKGVNNLQFIYGSNSYAHIDFNPNNIANRNEIRNITTVDETLGIVEKGITSIRGFI